MQQSIAWQRSRSEMLSIKMSLFAAFLCIGLIIQTSRATSVRRVKRNDFASNDPKVYYKATKAMVAKFNPLVEAVLMNLPANQHFYEYKQKLSNYLQKSDEDTSKKGTCFVKTFQNLEDFIELIMPLRYNTAGAEGKAVLQLFNEYGYTELEQDFENFVEGYNVEEFVRQVDKLSEADDFELLEEC